MNEAISILGLALALFLPGFFITYIFFREVEILERLLLSVTFSIIISVAIGIGLGYNENVKNLTGGITSRNVWKYEIIATSIAGILALLLNIRRISFKNLKNLPMKIKLPKRKTVKEKEIVKYRQL